jgi:phosphopantothenoylcysteine decarboxylase/phosphopantothenate--cysteine ligase
VVGFAAETHDVARYAAEKLMAKGCDWIVANDVGARDGAAPVFGADDNHVTLVTRKGAEPWEAASKRDVARKLVQRIAEALK